jgi:succinylglutamate desuccinylase
MKSSRLIGKYCGEERGPLVIVLGAVHGNEPAGVAALQEVFNMLEREPISNPDFEFKGCLVGFVGNVQAFSTNQRFISKDLNRMWGADEVAKILALSIEQRSAEEVELVELLTAIRTEIASYQPNTLVLLDLHTTSAEGGIFSIPLEDDGDSIELAQKLFAPVVLGLLDGLDGTLMHFAAANRFSIEGFPSKTVSVALEAGQHEDPESVSRSISGIVSCLRSVGCVEPEHVDSHHETILKRDVSDLPSVTRIVYVHSLAAGHQFQMRAGYVNFQTIHQGEHLADDRNGPVYAPFSGHILMPLYQKKGADGFFIVETLSQK